MHAKVTHGVPQGSVFVSILLLKVSLIYTTYYIIFYIYNNTYVCIQYICILYLYVLYIL